MNRFELRAYRRSDAPAVVDLINASSMRTVGFPRALVDSVGNLWAYRFVPLSSQKAVAIDVSGLVIGYAYFTSRDDHIVGETGMAVHPDYQGKGVEAGLLAWAEERAQNEAQAAPAGVRTVLQTILYQADQDAIQFFEDHGYQRAREWMHLVVDMSQPPLVPALDSRLTLREMDLDNDWDLVGPAMDDAYADHWGAIPPGSYESSDPAVEDMDETNEEDNSEDASYSNSPGYCFIVLDGDTVAGGILCNAKLVERADTGRVGSLFVRPGYRRQGIARLLLLASFEAFWRNGFRRVITDTDATSFTNAPRLYESVGMQPYRQEVTYEKEMRPGREVRLVE
jgi:mycothiol synthase